MRDPQTNRSADEMAAALEGDCVGFRWRLHPTYVAILSARILGDCELGLV